jgi:G3E family GTPase
VKLRDFFQRDVRADAQDTLQGLLRAVLMRAQFVPGARHALGWRGLKQSVASTGEGWTARIDGHAGVFGVCFNGFKEEKGWVVGSFGLSYFPDADEAMVECCSLRAAAYSQRPDYMSLVRDFMQNEELMPLFSVGTLFLALDVRQQALYLGMESPTTQRSIAKNGVRLPSNQGMVSAIEPGGYDQNFPSLPVTKAFFEVLAASVSYNLEQAPGWLIERRYPGMEVVYDDREIQSKPAPDIEDVFVGLGYGEGRFFDPFKTSVGRDCTAGKEILWCGAGVIPEDYRQMRWWKAYHQKSNGIPNKQIAGIDERPPLIVLSGFLGAGKTSFLQHFIEYQTQRSRFVAVIQNEIGDIGLDGKLLDYKVTEVDEGCICCSLVRNLKPAIQDILLSFRPDFIILETTGAANPFNLLDEISEVESLVRYDCTVTVVDAVNLDRSLSEFPLATEQIKAADVLLLNKCDLANEAHLQKARQKLQEINPKAVIFMAERGDLNPSLILDTEDRWAGKDLPTSLSDSMSSVPGSRVHDGLQCKTLTITDPIDRERFLSVVESLPPGVFRMKGIVEFSDTPQPMLFQYVAGRFELSLFPRPEVTDRFLTIIARGEVPDLARKLRSGNQLE